MGQLAHSSEPVYSLVLELPCYRQAVDVLNKATSIANVLSILLIIISLLACPAAISHSTLTFQARINPSTGADLWSLVSSLNQFLRVSLPCYAWFGRSQSGSTSSCFWRQHSREADTA